MIPEEYLSQVNVYLNFLLDKNSQTVDNRSGILALAGSWSDMIEDDLKETKESDEQM
ncbi:MAG: hypothetical protein AB8F95_06500 [Bacteroidia bacterium]